MSDTCEVCEMYRMEDSRWIHLVHIESHINGLHQQLAAKDAEIAELRARIEGLAKEWDVGSWNVGGNARDAARRLRAALAPKGGA